MKQNQITLIIIGFILVALIATNPSTEEHKEAVKEKVSAAFENNTTDGNTFQKLGEQLGQTIGMAIIDKMIKRENYLLFSLTKSNFLDNDEKEKVVGFGILGKVYLFNEFSEKIEESSKPIIGNTIKIGNLEISEKDFPNKMNWDDAKKACQSLGNGWRLPNKDELNLLYQNYYRIGGFAHNTINFYWSSTEDTSNYPWLQYFGDGLQLSSFKDNRYFVRAVRARKIEALKKNILKETIGSPIKIGNLEVAEKDFPKQMNWDDAIKACQSLGNGWRLPNKDELNLLYQNKYKISGFAHNQNKYKIGDFANYGYWSSAESNYGSAWYQDFGNGAQNDDVSKNGEFNVRAVRAF